MKNLTLLKRIFIALILGVILGITCSKTGILFPVKIFATFSGLFGNFLSFVIPFIIIGFIVPGIANLGKSSGKTLLLTTAFAYVSTIIAGTIAYLLGVSILPKLITKATLSKGSGLAADPYFTINIPPMFDIMSALVFAFVMGIALSKMKNSSLLNGFNEFSKIITMVIEKVLIPLVPVYIFSIFAKLSLSGEIFTTLKSFAFVYAIIIPLQLLYILAQYSLAGGISGKNLFKMLKNQLPSYFTALGTQSSAATIPVNLKCVKENGVSEDIADFVVPLCATIHLAGDTITLVLASMGVMYLNNKVPTFTTMMPFIFMLGVTMVAAPGVPGGGVMAALGLLQSMLGFGDIEKSIMIALHAAQDSFGTATNVTGDGAIAVIMDYIIRKLAAREIKKETVAKPDLELQKAVVNK